MPVPIAALKIAMGDMTQMLSNSTRAIPQRMIDQKYKFKFKDAVLAVRDLLDNKI